MPNTLGLDDDLDGVEVVRDLERIFDITLSRQEAERIFKVGEFHDLLLQKIPPDESDRKCATAIAFYRIRRALRRLGFGHDLAPASDIRAFERGRTRQNLKKLERDSGLRMPRPAPTWIGRLAALCCFVVILVGTVVLQPGFPATLLAGALFGLLAAGTIIIFIDPGKLPANCTRLADITKIAAAMNYGRLVRMGARHREEDIWENLVESLSRYALPKSEITRETYFLKSQLEKNVEA
jgi:hypothetical protein